MTNPILQRCRCNTGLVIKRGLGQVHIYLYIYIYDVISQPVKAGKEECLGRSNDFNVMNRNPSLGSTVCDET